MRTPPPLARLLLLLLLLLVPVGLAAAPRGTSPRPDLPPVDGTPAFARRAAPAMVGLRVEASPDAPSSANLGTERAGSAVIFDPAGYALSVSYLLLDAERIEVTTVRLLRRQRHHHQHDYFGEHRRRVRGRRGPQLHRWQPEHHGFDGFGKHGLGWRRRGPVHHRRIGNAVIANTTISNLNMASGAGGGARIDGVDGTLTIEGCTISGNVATDGYGGGLYLTGIEGATTIAYSTIAGNDAGQSGGGIEWV